MKRVGGWIAAVCLVLLAHAPAGAAELCEMAMLAPQQATERVIESYRGLLEFGGNELTETRLMSLLSGSVSLEEFFAAVPVGDQRSVALNQSLSVLGDWVLLGEHGIMPEVLIVRLREVVRDCLRMRQSEGYRVEEAREVSREPDELLRSYEPHGRYLIGADFTAQKGWVLSSGEGGVRLWNLAGKHQVTTLTAERGQRVLMFPDGWRFVTYERGGTRIRFWDLRTPGESREVELPFETGFKASVWGSGDFVLLTPGGQSGERKIVHSLTGQVVQFGADSTLRSPYALSPDGRRIAFLTREGQKARVEIWEMPDPGASAQVATRVFDGEAPFAAGGMTFGRDASELILITGGQMSFRAYRIEGDRLVSSWEQGVRRRFAGVQTLAWRHLSAQPSLIYAEPSEILLLNPDTGAPTQSLPHPFGLRVSILKLSPSERYLLAGYSDLKTIIVWDLDTGRIRARLHSHFRPDREFKFSPDEGSLLMSQPGTGILQVWNLELADQI